MLCIEHEEIVQVPSYLARGLHRGGNLEAMFRRECGFGPRKTTDLNASRRVKLAGEPRRRLAFALQALLQQFFLSIGLREGLDKHRTEQKGDCGAGHRGIEKHPCRPVCSEASCTH